MKCYLKILICILTLSLVFSMLTSCTNANDNVATVDETAKSVPWENGGKQPSEYTWEEFQALSGAEQELFVESFESAEAYEKWENNAVNNQNANLPENNGKKPSEYTWEEFQALSGAEQEVFIESFQSAEAFEEWSNNAISAVNKFPWENGGKQPSEYTWEEFQALSGVEQEAFVESFSSTDAFEKWENSVMPQG